MTKLKCLGCFCGRKFLTKNYLIKIGDNPTNKQEDTVEKEENDQPSDDIHGEHFLNENEGVERFFEKEKQDLKEKVKRRIQPMSEREAKNIVAKWGSYISYGSFKDHLRSLSIHHIERMGLSALSALLPIHEDDGVSNEEFFKMLKNKISIDEQPDQTSVGNDKPELIKDKPELTSNGGKPELISNDGKPEPISSNNSNDNLCKGTRVGLWRICVEKNSK